VQRRDVSDIEGSGFFIHDAQGILAAFVQGLHYVVKHVHKSRGIPRLVIKLSEKPPADIAGPKL
jgi:hypothetical protein